MAYGRILVNQVSDAHAASFIFDYVSLAPKLTVAQIFKLPNGFGESSEHLEQRQQGPLSARARVTRRLTEHLGGKNEPGCKPPRPEGERSRKTDKRQDRSP